MTKARAQMAMPTAAAPITLPPICRMKLGARYELVLAAGDELWADAADRAHNPKALAAGPCAVIAQVALDGYDEQRVQLYWRVAAHRPVGEAAEVLDTPDGAWLRAEVERLREVNARLGDALASIQDELRAARLAAPHAEALLALARTIARMPHAIGLIAVAELARLGLPRR